MAGSMMSAQRHRLRDRRRSRDVQEAELSFTASGKWAELSCLLGQRAEPTGPVGGRHDEDLPAGLQTVHLRQQLVDHPHAGPRLTKHSIPTSAEHSEGITQMEKSFAFHRC